jgi:photosystem II stability/assembly factor-like uncharacterized protein
MKKRDSSSPGKQARRRRILLVLAVFSVLSLAAAARAQTGTANLWTTNGPAGGDVLSLAMDPHDSATLFAATGAGIFNSANRGQSWGLAPVEPQGARALAFDPSNPSILFAGNSDGVFRSTDGGGHFSLTGLHNRTAALAIDPTNSTTMYAGGTNADIQKSTDGGGTWNALSTRSLVRSVASLLVDQMHSGTIYAGTDWDDSYYFPFRAIIKTTDGGANWLPAFSLSYGAVTALAADPRSSDILYAGFSEGWGSVARTQDGGITWRSRRVSLATIVSSIAIDPVESTTIYAGTDRGVFRSLDAGANWARFGEGLPDTFVSSLAIDPTGEFLHAGTGSGVFDLRVQRVSPVSPCSPGADHLCLLGGRFLVTLLAQDPRTGRITDGASAVQGDGFGYFSLPDFTGDPALPEVLVKMLDASASEWRSFWFFFSGLTDVAYAITVTDTISGQIRSYQNDRGSPYCGGGDTSAFPADAAAIQAGIAHARAASTLSASGTELSLLSGRFTLTLSATDPRTGRTGLGAAIPQNDRFGYFSLPGFTGEENLPEVFVKMVDATSFAGDFWLFYTGLTDLDYTLTATDTVTGKTRTYTSPAAFCGAADTAVTRP